MKKRMYTMILSDGRRIIHYDDHTEREETVLDRATERVRNWWRTRAWRRRQREFERTGTRYYGDGGTIHHSGHLDVETKDGKVVSVWFRCQLLPFSQTEVHESRADSMTAVYAQHDMPELCGVELRDPDQSGE